ncbi:MAG: VWA domain-containing protein [Burkholderiales bacterium]
MTYLWPEMLWLLLAAPALVGGYVLLLRRKKKGVLRYASLSLVKDAIGPGQRIRRHVPPLLFLAAMIAALVAIARPSAVVTLPSEQRTIILAIDVSLSMRATDVEPNRLAAAQAAAKAFIAEQPADVRIGIVSFAGTASLVQQPTQNREDLIAAIDRLQLQRHTAIGSGVIVSLAAVFPDEDIDLESVIFGRAFARERNAPIEGVRKAEKKPFQPVAPGSYGSAAIILLTDGRRTTGPDPIEAAKMAADRGVRIFTVGFGTAAGGAVDIDGWSIYMRFDEQTLKAIADVTRAQYFHAGSAADLQKVYGSLNAKLVLERKETEITALFAAAAAVLAAASAALSILWFHRLA